MMCDDTDRLRHEAEDNPYIRDDENAYTLVPPRGEYPFELAVTFTDDYPDFSILTWERDRDEILRTMFADDIDLTSLRIVHLDLGVDDTDEDERLRQLLEQLAAADFVLRLDDVNLTAK